MCYTVRKSKQLSKSVCNFVLITFFLKFWSLWLIFRHIKFTHEIGSVLYVTDSPILTTKSDHCVKNTKCVLSFTMDCFGHLIQCTIRICKNKILIWKHFLETEARSRGCDLPSRTHHGTRFFLSVDRNIYYNFYSTTIHLFVQSKRDLNDF